MNSQCTYTKRLVGTRIHGIREEQGLSLRKLAQMVNMDFAYLCSIENAKANPTLDTLSKIADGLDVSVVEFFSGDSETEYVKTHVD